MGNFLKYPLGIRRIDEGGLNRLKHHGRHGMVVLSANRSSIASDNPENDLSAEYEKFLRGSNGMETDSEETREMWLSRRNAEADKELLADIKKAKFAFTKAFGGYHGTDDVVDSYEPSYIVYNHAASHSNDYGNWDKLKLFAIAMCGKYKQDSVYVQAPGEPPVYLDRHGNQVSKSSTDNFKYNRDNETFYTTLKRDKTSPQRFTADIQFESIYHTVPSSYNERVKRTYLGEVFLDK